MAQDVLAKKRSGDRRRFDVYVYVLERRPDGQTEGGP